MTRPQPPLRLRNGADELAAEAERLETAASAGYERFDRGQPILLGHRSARSALRDRERADNQTRRAIAARQDARRAQAAANLARDEAQVAAVRAQQSRPWARGDFQPGDLVEVRVGRRTEEYRVVRANAKTLTCRNAFTIDDTKKTYDQVLSRSRGGVTTTDPAPAPESNVPPRAAR